MATKKSTNSWVLSEFHGISFGDKRINDRFFEVACDGLENPSARINVASEDWAAAKAAYRFFDNPNVTREEIFRCHQETTINRMKNHKTVLAIHDSSYIDFSNHTKLKGKGPIGTRQQNLTGYVMHSTLMVSSNSLPLGLLHHDLWARDEIKKNRSAKNNKLPIEKKESYKWIKSLNTVHISKPQETEVIHLADREADFFDFLEEAVRLEEKIIVRARYDRELTQEETQDYKEEEENKKNMWAFMLNQPVCFNDKIQVSRNHIHIKGKNKREFKRERIADVEVRVGRVTFNPGANNKKKSPLTYNLVLIKEANPPEGEPAVEWVLITNLPIQSIEEVTKIICYYRMRWMIEEYHKMLKTGCNIEDCLLESTEGMFLYITLFSIIAWRLYWVTHLQRIDPDMPCTRGFADVEWRGIYCYLHRSKKPPDRVPTIREVIVWIARLGGFLARKGDGEPGIVTVWRGWVRLNDIVSTYELFS
jgi:Transposase DNA-binding/Transposase Tn5 dimerisation domain